MNDLLTLLISAQANNFGLYTKTHSYHWNILSPMFPEYHKFLEEIYADAQESIDAYGEQLRRLGQYPDISYPALQDAATIDLLQGVVKDPEAMWPQLIKDLDTIILNLQNTFDAATTQREYGLQNFLADRIDTHKKQLWMIEAITGQ
jgi:starvation-inducible DNA-binding protein